METHPENDRFCKPREFNPAASASCLTAPQTGFPRVKSLTAAELLQLVLVMEQSDPTERLLFRIDDEGFVRRRTRGGPIVGKVETVREAVLTTIHAGLSVMSREEADLSVGSAHAPAAIMSEEERHPEEITIAAEVAQIPDAAKTEHRPQVGSPQTPVIEVRGDVSSAGALSVATGRSTGAPAIEISTTPTAIQLIKVVPLAKEGSGSRSAAAPAATLIHEKANSRLAATTAKPRSIVQVFTQTVARTYFAAVSVDRQYRLTQSQAVGLGILLASFAAAAIGVRALWANR